MKIRKMKWALVVLGLLSFHSMAAFFSAGQIAQFKQLPKAEQEALAKQYGVNLSDLSGLSSNSQQPMSATVQQTIQSRSSDPSSDSTSKNSQSSPSSGLVDFGYDLFSGQPSSYTPVDDLPAPNNYMIAPGDELDIQLFGSQNQSYQLTVSRDGFIQFPALGPIQVSGQTFSELKVSLTKRIKKQILGVDVSITLGALRTMQVYVTGDVYQSGAYTIPSLATVTQALIAAGGFRKTGSLRHVEVRRNNKVVVTLDLYDLLLKGDAQHDIRLQPGDTVFVGAKGATASIDGEVRRPARYEILSGETLGTLLKNAGGSDADGYLQQVQIKRFKPSGIQVLTADVTTEAGREVVLQSGDHIHLDRIGKRLQDAVMVRGAVTRQGAYAFHDGMKISDLFTNTQDDLLLNADQNYALVVREIDAEHHIKVLQFDLAAALATGSSNQNLLLHKSDQVFVFSNDLKVGDWQEPNKSPKATQTSSPASQNDSRVQTDPTTGVQLVKGAKSGINLFSSENSASQNAGPDSRQTLLKPIIERLRQQAVNGQPLAVYEIAGEVPFPGAYPLVEGATLKEAIAAAGGLLESAAKDKAELTRSVIMPGQVSLEHERFNLGQILSNQAPDFALVSKDRIVIQRKTNWSMDNTVEVQGEVRHPGTYTISKGETIADLVARAGGLTNFAYAQGAIFSRSVLRQQEQQRMKMLADNLRQEIASLALRRQSSSAQYTTSPTDALKVVDDLNTVPAMGRLVINLPSILKGDANSDVMLENGDKLFIPPKRNVVSVVGQVQMASNFTLNPAYSVQDYINMSGGEKKQADTRRIYVIRANGSVMLPNQSSWFSRSSKPLESGDTIVVPIDTDYLDGLSALSTASQIMYQIGVAWKAVN